MSHHIREAPSRGMRPGRCLAARSALAALLVVRAGAASRELEDSKTCSPQHDIFKVVLGEFEGDYIYDGDPEVSLKTENQYEHLPRGCRKWAGQKTCCKDKLWEMVEFEWVEEAEQIHAIRDVYTHLVPDVITPAVEELASHSQEDLAQQLAEVAVMVEEGRVGEAIAAYIDGCEDPIRLHFAATTCELCNPAIAPTLLEGKYMEVDANACKALWSPCSKSVYIIEAVGAKLTGAAVKLKAVVDAGVKSEKVAFAHTWVDGAAHQVLLAAKRIGFYKEEMEFCKRLQDKGYMYDPKDWGDLDLLHPGLAKKAYKEEEAEKREEAVLVSRATVESRDTQCVHGWLRGSDCFCQPCWEGLYCEIPAKPGPMRAQPFSPLVADNVMGSQQPLPVIGCLMPMDLTAQLARIKLLQVKHTGHNGRTPLLKNEADPCPHRDPAEGSFRELPLQVPVSASETRLEYLVQAPQGSEGLYAVCFCFGAECLNDTPSWWRIGHIKVVRTDNQAVEEGHVELAISEKDPNALHPDTGPAECDAQWKSLPMPSTAFTWAGKDAVTFECRPGYSDRVGPLALKCRSGKWYAIMEAQEGNAPNVTVAWDRQLPRCRWGHRDCASPREDGRLPGGGAVQVEDGVATYTCPFSSTMVVDAANMKLKAGDRVASKATFIAGEIVRPASNSSNNSLYEVLWKVQRLDEQDMASTVNAHELWLVLKDGVFMSYCQPDKSWAPVVGVVTCKGQKGARTIVAAGMAGGATGVAPGATGAGRGPCGGTFGIPEVRRGEAFSLIETLLPQPLGFRPETASLLELGKAEQPEPWPLELGPANASLLELGGQSATEAAEPGPAMRELAGAGASMLELGGQAGLPASRLPSSMARPVSSAGTTRMVGRHALSSSSLMDGGGGPPLHIRKWPVRFTKDPAKSFMVDRCWTTRECSAPGVVPPDMAAAQTALPPKKEHETGRHASSSQPLVAIIIFVVLLASLLLRSLWLSVCASSADKHAEKAAVAAASSRGQAG